VKLMKSGAQYVSNVLLKQRSTDIKDASIN
jgi:hypothetical protein